MLHEWPQLLQGAESMKLARKRQTDGNSAGGGEGGLV